MTKKDQIRLAAENDLESFIKLVHPKRVLGEVHREILRWWTRPDSKSHQLLLLPRDHQKSALVAYRVAWWITKFPWLRVLYISSTSNLATKQLKFIKDILTCDVYRYYWPGMVLPEEARREKWTETEISIDHPLRAAENVRDPTIFTAGLTTSIVGLHCDVSVFDDVVVPENAYTGDGREKVQTQYSYLASIEGADALQWVVGTRYHPIDLYHQMAETQVEVYNDVGEVVALDPLYEAFERKVEDKGDGTGVFIWPRQKRSDGKWFGFNDKILARKRAQYLDKSKFRAQYYNDPYDITEAPIGRDLFQYYDRKYLRQADGHWTFQGRRLNVFAAIDFAYSLNKDADYSALVVAGIDQHQNYFVLDLVRFKTKKPSEYFKEILVAHQKWGFRKIRAEITAAQAVLVQDLKDNYIRPYGLMLAIDEVRHTSKQGTKEDRIYAVLQPRYDNRQVWHYQDGLTAILEEELVLKRPPHDDIKDALAMVVDMCIAPSNIIQRRGPENHPAHTLAHKRYGGFGVTR